MVKKLINNLNKMKYMGSKSRLVKYLLPILNENKINSSTYIEPFCGGLSVIEKVTNYKTKIAADNNYYLIKLWNGLKNGNPLIYPITKELYDEARDHYMGRKISNLTDYEVAAIGWTASFNGRFFDGGYSGNYLNRNYILEQFNNITKQIPLLKDIEFIHSSYDKLNIPNGSVIYCDPPYSNTKPYSTSNDFNHKSFWEWCREKSKDNILYVSEYEAPPDFDCIWEMKFNVNMKLDKSKEKVEKLFMIKKP